MSEYRANCKGVGTQLDCDYLVPEMAAGYCKCSENHREKFYSCYHPSFSCSDYCDACGKHFEFTVPIRITLANAEILSEVTTLSASLRFNHVTNAYIQGTSSVDIMILIHPLIISGDIDKETDENASTSVWIWMICVFIGALCLMCLLGDLLRRYLYPMEPTLMFKNKKRPAFDFSLESIEKKSMKSDASMVSLVETVDSGALADDEVTAIIHVLTV